MHREFCTRRRQESFNQTQTEMKARRAMYEQRWTLGTHALRIMRIALVPAMQEGEADYENNFGQSCTPLKIPSIL